MTSERPDCNRNMMECPVIDWVKEEIMRLRAALEDARRDLNALCPRSDTGSKRKRAIEEAIKRIEDALSPADA